MGSKAEQSKRRTYRRERRYPQKLSVGFAADQFAELEAVAERYGLAVGDVIRQAASAGLSKLCDKLRKRAN